METHPFAQLIPLLVSGAIVLGLFLLFREVVCWYWKINEGIALLSEIRDLLRDARGNP
jgi:hypothetical protein